jgi:O-antigen ligase
VSSSRASPRADARIEPATTPTSSRPQAERAARFSLPLPTPAAVEAALAATGLGTFVVWAWHDGGYAPEEWLPGGLLLLALVCTAAVSADVRRRWRAWRVPLLLFGLYVAWSYVSLLWSQVPADALDGANRTLVYWLVFALFAGLGISERLGGALVLAGGVAVAALGLLALAQAAIATTPAGHFVQGRLAAPLSYPDGDAALFLFACLPLVVLASRPRANAASRVIACAAAAVLADLAVLCQSRGSLVALPLAVVLYLALTRRRLRAFAHLVITAAAVAPAMPALLHVYSAVIAGHGRSAAVTHAGSWIAGSAALAIVGMVVLLLVERHIALSYRTRRLVGGVLLAGVGSAVVAAAVIAAGPHPLGRADRVWHDFTTNKTAEPTTFHFAAGVGTTRYDVWRIAVDQFLAHPLKGAGSDNFLVGYLRNRRTSQTSRYPQSVELRAFSETGIVGAALFLGFLTLAFWRAARAAHRSPPPGVALACIVSCGYWLFHASIDWFWELPALTGAAVALLAIAGAAAPALPQAAATWRPIKVAAASGTALVAAAALAIPWASVSLADAAVARGGSRSAYSLLEQAASLNPWSERPALAEATLAANVGDRVRERQALLQARQRNRFDWYPYFMLGIVAGREHHLALARAELERAHRLSPRDLIIVYAQRRLQVDEPLTERQVGRIFREATSTLRGVRQR